MVSKMKCPNCGKEISADSNFCIFCGAKVSHVSRQSMAVNCGNNVAQNAGAGETSWQKWEIGEVKKKGKVVWAESYGKFILASLINEICFELGIIFLFYFNIIGILGGCLEFTCHKCHIGWLLLFCYCQS